MPNELIAFSIDLEWLSLVYKLCNHNKFNILIREKIILGIDPGTSLMGYGILKIENNKPSVIARGVIRLTKYADHALKMKKIFERVQQLIDEYHPDEMALEAPFYGKNVQRMLKLGRAQGVALAAGISRDMPYVEYAPKKIKQSITGNGNASKEQVAGMLISILKLDPKNMPKDLDATDGLAAALCHFYQGDKGDDQKDYGSWKSFISQNPGKVK